MITAKVLLESGNSITTGFNGSFENACGYYRNFCYVTENDVTGKEFSDYAVGLQILDSAANWGKIVYFNPVAIAREIAVLEGLFLEYQTLKHGYPFAADYKVAQEKFNTAKVAFERKYHASLRDVRIGLMPESAQSFLSEFTHVG